MQPAQLREAPGQHGAEHDKRDECLVKQSPKGSETFRSGAVTRGQKGQSKLDFSIHSDPFGTAEHDAQQRSTEQSKWAGVGRQAGVQKVCRVMFSGPPMRAKSELGTFDQASPWRRPFWFLACFCGRPQLFTFDPFDYAAPVAERATWQCALNQSASHQQGRGQRLIAIQQVLEPFRAGSQC